jgi:hypothetical protein
MLKTIYVGNLPFTATDDDVRNLFSKHGTVHSVKLVSDRDTGKPRGFGFVEMEGSAAPTLAGATCASTKRANVSNARAATVSSHSRRPRPSPSDAAISSCIGIHLCGYRSRC